jgi:alkanesulfonate monooxygenase SsuD/methylene tetrahydromethanopterin reductase-like flavin-dependent oxidoreductase (luciferase family)
MGALPSREHFPLLLAMKLFLAGETGNGPAVACAIGNRGDGAVPPRLRATARALGRLPQRPAPSPRAGPSVLRSGEAAARACAVPQCLRSPRLVGSRSRRR